MTKSWLESKIDSPEKERLCAEEELILQTSELLVEAQEQSGMSRLELAQKLGVSAAFISQVLNGHRNMTLKTAAALAWGLGQKIRIELVACDDETTSTK